MKDKIKEIIKFQDILNYYKAKQIEPTYCEELITTGELQHLLDYITNLQDTLKDREEYCNGLETHLTNLQCDVDSYKTKYKNAKENLKVLQEENFNYRKLGFKHLCDKNKELEEENEKLNKELDYANNDNIYYIAKIDKAIEYINKNKHLSMFADCREPEEDWNYELEINPRDLLNILNGGDKK